MDGNRFDDWARSLLSRRRVVRTLAGISAGAGLAHGVGAAPKKKGGGSRFGCTKHDNTCSAKAPDDIPCPDAPADAGAFCVTNNKGKPVCAADGACSRCKRNADCVGGFGPTAQCIKKCPACQKNQGGKSACIVPFTAAPTG